MKAALLFGHLLLALTVEVLLAAGTETFLLINQTSVLGMCTGREW